MPQIAQRLSSSMRVLATGTALRSGLVWDTFMRNPVCANAMKLTGF